MFLTVMVVGLAGLVMMALPGVGGRHHLPSMRGHGHGLGHPAAHGHPGVGRGSLIPSPRAVFSVCALYGAFGNALVRAAHMATGPAALIAIAPALLTEWFLIRPVWNLLFRCQGHPSSPLEALVLSEARAVVPFRNGRGLVTTVRDGRSVQLVARLCDEQAELPVAVGQTLQIEDVDARREIVTVSLFAKPKQIDTST